MGDQERGIEFVSTAAIFHLVMPLIRYSNSSRSHA